MSNIHTTAILHMFKGRSVPTSQDSILRFSDCYGWLLSLITLVTAWRAQKTPSQVSCWTWKQSENFWTPVCFPFQSAHWWWQRWLWWRTHWSACVQDAPLYVFPPNDHAGTTNHLCYNQKGGYFLAKVMNDDHVRGGTQTVTWSLAELPYLAEGKFLLG